MRHISNSRTIQCLDTLFSIQQFICCNQSKNGMIVAVVFYSNRMWENLWAKLDFVICLFWLVPGCTSKSRLLFSLVLLKGELFLDTLDLWQSALLILEPIEVTKLWYLQCSQHVRTVNRYFYFVTRPCSFKQVTIYNQMQASSMQDNDKFPSSSIVNCCTDVIFQLASFSSLFLYKCLKIWLF